MVHCCLFFPLSFYVHIAPVRGAERFFIKANVLFCAPKENQKSRFERLGGGEAMKAPVGLLSRQSGLRSKCRVFSAARTGIHEKGATRPFQTPKGKSKWKNASRFAKRIFLTSPICCSAAGVTSLLTVKFCESLKSSAKP